MDRHSKNYELLGIRPGDSWQRLRDSYKSVVRRWHPDRFTQNNTERGIAEEKTKEINRAYQELQEYFQQHGCMPLDGTQRATPQSDEAVTTSASTGQSSSKSPASDPNNWTPVSKGGQRKNVSHGLRISLILLILLMATYYLFVPNENELPYGNHHAGSSINAPGIQPEQTPQHVEKKYFSTGSSLGEVHSIQGIPTRIEGNTWYYGDAKVVFLNGKVSHWIDSAEHNLLALAGQDLHTQGTVMQYFSKGSSKIDVKAIQGAPMRETENVWDYGLSRIYFEGDKVVGWHESPLEPLRIKK